ncbi:MAG: phosphatase [Bacteroidota bacterium]
MIPRLAVIDLGTNTFHLLIVEVKAEGGFRELYRERRFVKLAEDGIQRIGPAPFQRGLDALVDFAQIIQQQQVQRIRAFGTAALRTAQNGADFIDRVRNHTNLDIQLIPGSEEARLIHQGVVQAVSLDARPALIMDIGGGSVEFILANAERVFWAQSFPIGVAVLYREWQHSDPISAENVTRINAFLDQTLVPLHAQIARHQPRILVGASGTFDVLEQQLAPPPPGAVSSEVAIDPYHHFARQLRQSSLSQRRQMPQLPLDRSDMIVVAIVLIDYIVRLANIQSIRISAYAMKEGMLHEMIDPNFRQA